MVRPLDALGLDMATALLGMKAEADAVRKRTQDNSGSGTENDLRPDQLFGQSRWSVGEAPLG